MNDKAAEPRRRLHAVGRTSAAGSAVFRAHPARPFLRRDRAQGGAIPSSAVAAVHGAGAERARRGAFGRRPRQAAARPARARASDHPSKAVADGERTAVAPFLKALDRLDRYHKLAREHQEENDDARRKLIAKINFAAANLGYDAPAAPGQEA